MARVNLTRQGLVSKGRRHRRFPADQTEILVAPVPTSGGFSSPLSGRGWGEIVSDTGTSIQKFPKRLAFTGALSARRTLLVKRVNIRLLRGAVSHEQSNGLNAPLHAICNRGGCPFKTEGLTRYVRPSIGCSQEQPGSKLLYENLHKNLSANASAFCQGGLFQVFSAWFLELHWKLVLVIAARTNGKNELLPDNYLGHFWDAGLRLELGY